MTETISPGPGQPNKGLVHVTDESGHQYSVPARAVTQGSGASQDTVVVYVWSPHFSNEPGNKLNVGHASMQIGADTYVSHWPVIDENAVSHRQGGKSAPDQKYFFTAAPHRDRTFEQDLAAEGRAPDHTIVLHGLDTDKMRQHWEIHGLHARGETLEGPLEKWDTTERNCSTTVAETLKTGKRESSQRPSENEHRVWTPGRVKDYSLKIGGKSVPFESADPRNPGNLEGLAREEGVRCNRTSGKSIGMQCD